MNRVKLEIDLENVDLLLDLLKKEIAECVKFDETISKKQGLDDNIKNVILSRNNVRICRLNALREELLEEAYC